MVPGQLRRTTGADGTKHRIPDRARIAEPLTAPCEN